MLLSFFHTCASKTWLVYSNDGLPQNALGLPLVHPLHGNPYSLTLISIDGHLHSPLIRLVDVRLSSPFCLLHNHHSIPPTVLYPWLTLMYCVKVEKV
ncbi:hypothetical protein T12_11253 [Trichinella patagoniensis]|uniref:Uncharacterized protein n=1 Tax=Trichinella patagoniensis TaxID=990121 RepID=A0A0V0YWI3_9BILA|nr:hypothetical protein T12_11253 [Trichinella patagoniensis]